MKRIIYFICLFSFLAFTPSVLAETNCPTCGITQVQEEIQEEAKEQVKMANPDLGELRQNLLEKKELIRERVEERKATVAARLAEERKERIRFFYGRLTRRIQAAINRLETLIGRIESRLSKIEAEDEEIDTSEIRESLDEAKSELAEASAALSDAKTSLEAILASENPKEIFTEVRELIKGIKQQLMEVHQILVEVIGDIKELKVNQGE